MAPTNREPQRDDTIRLERIDPFRWAPSEACLAYMAEHGFDPNMPVLRGTVTPGFMAETMAIRPDVANIVQLLVGPFGIVAPEGQRPFRVAELKVGDVLINVEEEYKP